MTGPQWAAFADAVTGGTLEWRRVLVSGMQCGVVALSRKLMPMENLQTRTARTFDEYTKSYTSTVDDAVAFSGLTTDFFVQVKADHIIRIAERHFGRSSDLKVIDIGCGVGNYHPLLFGKFSDISGVDVSSDSIAVAREANPTVDYKVYDGMRLPYEDEQFDLAYTICVVHHVPPDAWPNFMREMRRVLKRGGIALVFEHNPLNPLTMRAVNNCPFDADAVLLKKSRTQELMSGADFKNVETEFILSVPPRGWILQRIDRALRKLPFGAQYVTIGTP